MTFDPYSFASGRQIHVRFRRHIGTMRYPSKVSVYSSCSEKTLKFTNLLFWRYAVLVLTVREQNIRHLGTQFTGRIISLFKAKARSLQAESE